METISYLRARHAASAEVRVGNDKPPPTPAEEHPVPPGDVAKEVSSLGFFISDAGDEN